MVRTLSIGSKPNVNSVSNHKYHSGPALNRLGVVAGVLGGLVVLASAWGAHADVAPDPKAIPFDKLSGESRELVRAVTQYPTFELNIGPRTLHGDRVIFEYLFDNLEHCALAGRRLGVANFTTRREKDGRIFGDDGETSTGYLTFVHAAEGKRVFHVEGTQKGLFTVGGHSVVVLEYVRPKNPALNRSEMLDYRLDVWVKVDSAFFAFLSRVFLSKSKSTADRQFTRLLGVPVGVTEKIHQDPSAVLKTVESLNETEKAALKDLRALIEKRCAAK
jgi:hypothetical protein